MTFFEKPLDGRVSPGHPAGVPAKRPFLSGFYRQEKERKALGHQPVDPCLSRWVSQGHPAGLEGIFFSLCAFFFPENCNVWNNRPQVMPVMRFYCLLHGYFFTHSSGALRGSLHGVASLKLEKAHFAA